MQRDNAEKKAELRALLKKKREALGGREVAELSKKICESCEELLENIRDKDSGIMPDESGYFDKRGLRGMNVLLYSPIRCEADLTGLFEGLSPEDGIDCYYPLTTGQDMTFHRVEDMTELISGNFGIMEPPSLLPQFSRDTAERKPSVIFVPGVGFDRSGARIGFGAGYYDRFLKEYPGIIRVGVCYELQLEYEVPDEAHDVRMQYIVTEKGVIKIEDA